MLEYEELYVEDVSKQRACFGGRCRVFWNLWAVDIFGLRRSHACSHYKVPPYAEVCLLRGCARLDEQAMKKRPLLN